MDYTTREFDLNSLRQYMVSKQTLNNGINISWKKTQANHIIIILKLIHFKHTQ